MQFNSLRSLSSNSPNKFYKEDIEFGQENFYFDAMALHATPNKGFSVEC